MRQFLLAVLAIGPGRAAGAGPERRLPDPARRPARDHRARGRDPEPADPGAPRTAGSRCRSPARCRRPADRRAVEQHHRRPAGLELRGAPERLRLGGRRDRGGRTTFPIFVIGQVGSPGQVEVEPGTTLLQAMALAGGLDRFAATKRIQLRRTDPTHRPGAALPVQLQRRRARRSDPVDDHAARGRRDHRSRTPPVRVRGAAMRRASLAALTLAGAAGDSPPRPRTWRRCRTPTLTATISQSFEADSNYNLDDPSPGHDLLRRHPVRPRLPAGVLHATAWHSGSTPACARSGRRTSPSSSPSPPPPAPGSTTPRRVPTPPSTRCCATASAGSTSPRTSTTSSTTTARCRTT